VNSASSQPNGPGENIANMRADLQRMGLSLDWRREFAACDPAHYGHQQKLFLDFLKAGLVERKESWVNRDPVDGMVPANKQVIDGRSWRSARRSRRSTRASGSSALHSTLRANEGETPDPGNLDLRARKDNHAHAHAPAIDRCRGGRGGTCQRL
jgi:hypothetical protein